MKTLFVRPPWPAILLLAVMPALTPALDDEPGPAGPPQESEQPATPGGEAAPAAPPEPRMPPAVQAEKERRNRNREEIRRLGLELDRNPSDAGILRELFELLMLEHEGSQALRRAEEFVVRNPSDAAGYLVLGRAHFWLGDYDRALLQFQRSVSMDPDHAGAHFWHSRILDATGDPDGALAALDRVIAVQPENVSALTTRAHFLEDARRYAEAGVLWRKIGELRSGGGTGKDVTSPARAALCRELAREAPMIASIPDGGVTVPLFSFNRVPALKVLLDGKTERYLVLDLSSRENVLTPQASRELRLKEFGGPSSSEDGATPGSTAHAVIGSMKAGPLVVRRIPFAVNPFLRYPTEELAGVLGRSFLDEFLVTIDYVGRKVTIAPPAGSPIDGIPVYYNSGVLVDARSKGRAAGKFLVDTSSYTPGPVSILFAQNHLGINAMTTGVTPIFYRNYSFSFTMPDLEIGGVRWRFFRATAVDLRSLSERIGTEISGILANSLLEDTRLTIDLEHRRIRIDRLRAQTFRNPSKLPAPPEEESQPAGGQGEDGSGAPQGDGEGDEGPSSGGEDKKTSRGVPER